jgi:hypothetical protein
MYGLWVELCCTGEPGAEGDEEKALYSHANCLGVWEGGWWRRVCGRATTTVVPRPHSHRQRITQPV